MSCLFPSPGDLPNPGIEAESPSLQADSSQSQSPGKPRTWVLRQERVTPKIADASGTGGVVSWCV